MTKKTVRYILISFTWTWAFWISAFILAKSRNYTLLTGETLFDLFRPYADPGAIAPQVIFALGVFGPLLGYLLVAQKQKNAFLGQIKSKFALLAFIIPAVTTLPAVLLSAFFLQVKVTDRTLAGTIITIGLYFLSNLLTSGTEEFGWRGFLYPHMREKKESFGNTAWKSGLIWAVWHYPLMLMLYWGMGVAVALPTLLGFTAGIVAMAYLSNYVYEHTHSIGLLMLMHAFNNTGTFILMLLYPNTPFTFLSSLVSWGLVIYLEKKHPIPAHE